MIRALWAGAIAALLVLGGCASAPPSDSGSGSQGDYESGGY